MDLFWEAVDWQIAGWFAAKLRCRVAVAGLAVRWEHILRAIIWEAYTILELAWRLFLALNQPK